MVIIMRQLFVSIRVRVRVVMATAKRVGLHVLQGTILGGIVQE